MSTWLPRRPSFSSMRRSADSSPWPGWTPSNSSFWPPEYAAFCVSLVGRSSFREAGVLASQAGIQGFFDFFHGAGRNALIALSFTLAWTVSPVAWQRIQAVRTAKQAKRGLLASAGLLAALYTLIVAAGILFRPVLGAPADGSPLLARFIASASGPWLGGLLFVAVMAAILSTLDAAINTGSLCLARDVYSRSPLGVPGEGS